MRACASGSDVPLNKFIHSLPLFILLLLCHCAPVRESSTLRWWHFWSEPYQKPTITALIDEFEKSNPDIKIDASELTWQSGHDKIVTAFASGRDPDVVELGSDWVYEFAARGVLRDITVDADSVIDDFYGWEPAEWNGKYFAFPWLLGTRALFVNTDLITDSISDWTGLMNAVRSAHRPDEGRYGFGNTKREPHQLYKKILPFFWSSGGDIVDASGRVVLDSPSNVSALQFYLELGKYGLLESQKILDDRFTEGAVGVVISGGWLIRKIERQNPDLSYRVMLMPSPQAETVGVSFYGGQYLAISKKCTKPDAALRWIRFLIDPRNAKRLCDLTKVTIPAARQNDEDPSPALSVMRRQLAHSRTSPLHSQWTEMERILEDEVEAALYGKKTAELALKSAHRRIEEILKP